VVSARAATVEFKRQAAAHHQWNETPIERPESSVSMTQAVVTNEQAVRTTAITVSITSLLVMAMLLPILWPTQSRTAVGGVVGDFDISVHYFSAIAASVAKGIAASGFITWAAALEKKIDFVYIVSSLKNCRGCIQVDLHNFPGGSQNTTDYPNHASYVHVHM
jgi:hypothetical protein